MLIHQMYGARRAVLKRHLLNMSYVTVLDTNRVEKWEAASTEAASLAGWDLRSVADGYVKPDPLGGSV